MKPVTSESKDPIKLNDDPLKALGEVSGYLSSINYGKQHEVIESDDGTPYVVGYWQTPEYLQGIVEIHQECKRIINLHAPEENEETSQVRQVHFSIDGWRTNLSRSIKELKEILEPILPEIEHITEVDDIKDKLNDIICSSNSFNCVSFDGLERFSPLGHIEVGLIE